MAREKGTFESTELWLGVLPKAPEEADGTWRTKVLVRCEKSGNRPFPHVPLLLLRDAQVQPRTGRHHTNERGLFEDFVSLPGPGEYFVGAMIEGTSFFVGEMVTVPKPEDPELVKARRDVDLGKLTLEGVRLAGELRDLTPKLTRKIEIVGTIRRGDHAEIILRRVGKDGRAEAGPIACWDFEPIEGGDPLWKHLEWRQRKGYEHVAIVRPLMATSRVVQFSLPDDPDVKSRDVRVPALAPAVAATGTAVATGAAAGTTPGGGGDAARAAGKGFANSVLAGLGMKPAAAVTPAATPPRAPWWKRIL